MNAQRLRPSRIEFVADSIRLRYPLVTTLRIVHTLVAIVGLAMVARLMARRR